MCKIQLFHPSIYMFNPNRLIKIHKIPQPVLPVFLKPSTTATITTSSIATRFSGSGELN
uniref:Uncharacterized protein n=1 Tax=Manihot esculenta TaxID=3983 RepID=A0A2C9UN49_MANES